jgi:hypothetical protein
MKLLLLNFTGAESEIIRKATGADVYRGYLSDASKSPLAVSPNKDQTLSFFTPIPPYECKMVFAKLGVYEEIRTEFEDKIKLWGDRDKSNLRQYWMRKGNLLVVFVGDTSITDLKPLGLPVTLTYSTGVDTESKVSLSEAFPIRNLVSDLNKQISMPASKYIRSSHPEADIYRLNTIIFDLVRNLNGDALSIALTKDNSDYTAETVGVIVMPLTKNIAQSVSSIFHYFDDTNPEWVGSDDFYPSITIEKLGDEITMITTKAMAEIAERQKLIDEHRQNYAYLKDLVTTQGDTLVNAVYKVLTDLMKLKVIRSDETNGSSQKEDLLVSYLDNQILIEVKGTKRSNPSLAYPQQTAQHALRQGLKNVSNTGLILNHDLETDPIKRNLAYNDEDTSPLIADIYYIDTRLLLDMSKQIIDGSLTPEDAADILFDSLGRAEFPIQESE